jgi:hypothetical protein
MNIKTAFSLILLTCIPASLFPQEKTSKELKEERKLEQQKQTETLVNGKDFVFIGTTALPQGGRSVNLTTRSNFMKFHPDLIQSDMPYFGRAYSGAAYGGDAGLKFEGKPEKYTVVRNKKNYQVNAEVKGENDTYKISLSVSFSGNASLTVVSNNRSTITYNGDIAAPEK